MITSNEPSLPLLLLLYSNPALVSCYRGQAVAGQSVLIHGASGGVSITDKLAMWSYPLFVSHGVSDLQVGTTCVQLAKQLGLEVYATAGTEQGMELVQACGADHVFNHKDPNYVELMKVRSNTITQIMQCATSKESN